MPFPALLDLSVNLQASLNKELPGILDEVNDRWFPLIPVTFVADSVLLGIRTDMLKREVGTGAANLPAVACGIYVREVKGEYEGLASDIVYPFVVDVYLGVQDDVGDGAVINDLYIQSQKWAIALDQWVERHASDLLEGYTSDEAPDLDISYVLELRGGGFRQLVSATGILYAPE